MTKERIIASDRLKWLLVLIGLLLLLPFFLLTFHAIPAADDFYFSFQASQLSFSDYVDHFYSRYTGRLFPTVLFYLNPMAVGNYHLYWLPLTLILVLFFWSVYLVMPVFTGKIRTIERLLLVIIVLLITLQYMPSTAQGFYWLSGALFYTVPLSIFLIFLRVLYEALSKPWNRTRLSDTRLIDPPVSTPEQKPYKRTLLFASGFFLALLIPLSNEVLVIPAALLLAFLFLRELVMNHRIEWFTLLAGIVMLAGIIVQLVSPGNFARIDDINLGQQNLPAILRVINPVFKLWVLMLMNPLLWLASLFALPVLSSRMKEANNASKPAWLVPIGATPVYLLIPVAFLIMMMMYLPSEYFSAYIPWRIHNTGSLFFLIMWFILLVRIASRMSFNYLPLWFKKAILAVSFIALISDFSWKGYGSELVFRGNIPLAWHDLFDGANEYSTRWYQFFDTCEEVGTEYPGSLVEKNISGIPIPRTLHYETIKEDPSHDFNRWYCLYFDLEQVWIVREEQ